MSRLLVWIFLSVCFVMSSILTIYWNFYPGQDHNTKLLSELGGNSGSNSFGTGNRRDVLFDRSPGHGHMIGEKKEIYNKKEYMGSRNSKYIISKIISKITQYFYDRDLKNGLSHEGFQNNELPKEFFEEYFENQIKEFNDVQDKDDVSKGDDSLTIIRKSINALNNDIRILLITKLKLRERLQKSLLVASRNAPPPTFYDDFSIHGSNSSGIHDADKLKDLSTLNLSRVSPAVPNTLPSCLRRFYSEEIDAIGDLLPILFLVTPTIQKPQQRADLTRLSQTLSLVPNAHWIVVEDGVEKRNSIQELLANSGLSYTHLNAKTPDFIKDKLKEHPYKPRGSAQRNAGIDWLRKLNRELQNFTKTNLVKGTSPFNRLRIEEIARTVIRAIKYNIHNLPPSTDTKIETMPVRSIEGMSDFLLAGMVSKIIHRLTTTSTIPIIKTVTTVERSIKSPGIEIKAKDLPLRKTRLNKNSKYMTPIGIVYFADDDNTYDLQIFEEMRYVQRVGVWPVGLVGGLWVEKPIVNLTTGRVNGFDVFFGPNREFAVDMAGFAVNFELLMRVPHARFNLESNVGYVETTLLRHLVRRSELEALADNCTKVYVWHTKTQTPELQYEKHYKKYKNKSSNHGILV